MPTPVRIGIDVGGTKIELGLVDAEGRILERMRLPTPQADTADPYAAFVSGLGQMIDSAVGKAGLAAGEPIGLCIPGEVQASDGAVKNSNAQWMNGRKLKADLEARIARPAFFANDGACFTLSEAADGAAAGAQAVFGVVLGTGVGGGIALFGRPWRGAHAIAAEWGHNPFPVRTHEEIYRLEAELGEAPACFCGRPMCVESVLRGEALAARYAVLAGSRLEGADLAAAIEAEEPAASQALNRYARDLAQALSVVTNMIDPDVIVLGGGLSEIDRLYPLVNDALPQFVFHAGSQKTRPRPVVLKNKWGATSGLRGAAWLPATGDGVKAG